MATQEQLRTAHYQISNYMAGPAATDVPVFLSYIDPTVNAVIVGTSLTSRTPGELRQILDLDESVPLSFVECEPAELDAGKRQPNRPLVGGLLVSTYVDEGPSIHVDEGTLTVAADRDGVKGFVTAGHVVEKEGIAVFQPYNDDDHDRFVGTVTKVVNDNRGQSDCAFVESPSDLGARRIWKADTDLYQIVDENDPQVGTKVYMQGSQHPDEQAGVVAHTRVSVKFKNGQTKVDQCIATYHRAGGDSGAPVYSKKNNGRDVTLLGMHIGGQTIRWGEVMGDVNPPVGQNGSIAVITPWSNVAHDLGVILDV